MIAMDINALVIKEDCESWYLAAGKKINKEIISQLEPEVKAKLEKNIPVDLTKVRKADILSHFA
jgi:hypothetical protein